MRRKLSSLEETIINNGVVEMKTKSVLVEAEPPYVKLYLEDIVMLHDLPKSCSDILFVLIKNSMTYSNNLIINNYIKDEVVKTLGYKSRQSISNAITKFVGSDIMRRISTGVYMLNPNLFARGAWKDIQAIRSEWLHLSISYDTRGRRIIEARNENEHQEKMVF